MTIEVTAKKVEDAINQGLRQLGATLDEVDVEVIESGGLFRKAKVRLTVEREAEQTDRPVAAERKAEQKEQVRPVETKQPAADPVKAAEQKQDRAEPREKNDVKPRHKQNEARIANEPKRHEKTEQKQKPAEKPAVDNAPKPRKPSAEDKIAAEHAFEFVKTVVNKMGFESATVTEGESGEAISIIADGGDDSLLIGRHGETLSALSYLAETIARAEKCHVNITVDCNGYRDRRAASLTAMAKRRADECAAKRRKIKLEPMERVDRRTVHNALTGDNRVSTASEGKEPHRYVVIIPNNR